MSPGAGLPPTLQGVPLFFAASYLQNGAHLILMQSVLLGNAKLRAASTVSPGIVPSHFLHNNKGEVMIYYVKAMNTSFLNNRTAQPKCVLHGQMFTYLFGINTFLTGFPQGTMMGSPS